MGLTITEKDHFKQRLTARVEELSDILKSQDPAWRRDVQAAAIKLVEERFDVQGDMEDLMNLRQVASELRTEIAEKEQLIVSKMRGIAQEDLPAMSDQEGTNSRRQRYDSYANDDNDNDFQRYPGQAKKYMQALVKRRSSEMVAAHATGGKLQKLKKMCFEFEDQIATAGTHNQLAAVWENIKTKLDIFDKDTPRTPRKVTTTRAKAAKAAKAETS